MSDLTQFRDYARRLANGGHTPACIDAAEVARYRRVATYRPCAGNCVSEADRELWTRLASEIDDYLEPQPDLFGELTTEPPAACAALQPTHTDTEKSESA